MTNTQDSRPLCQWVQEDDHKTGKFHEQPGEFITHTDNHATRCTHYSVAGFKKDGTVFYGCEYHAPEDILEALNTNIPQNRKREGRISV